MSAAITDHRVLGPAEAGIMAMVSVVILVLVAIGLLWPLAVVLPLGVLGGWIAVSLLARAYVLRREGARGKAADKADDSASRPGPS